MEEKHLKQQITKLVAKKKNLQKELVATKDKIRFLKARNEKLLYALELNGIKPILACSCYKEDCGCFEASIKHLTQNQ